MRPKADIPSGSALLDLAATGFDPAEVDAIMGDFGEDRANPADERSLRSRK